MNTDAQHWRTMLENLDVLTVSRKNRGLQKSTTTTATKSQSKQPLNTLNPRVTFQSANIVSKTTNRLFSSVEGQDSFT